MAVVFTDAGEAAVVTRLQASAGAPTYFVGVGTGATAYSKASTTISTEVETRASATPTVQTTGSTGDTLRCIGTQTMGSGRVVTNGALLDASTSGTLYVGSDGLSITLSAGDSLQQTFNLQQT